MRKKCTTPTCPKCGNPTFEMQELTNIKHANFRHNVINCTACGAIVSVHEMFNLNFQLAKLAEQLGVKLDV